MPKSDVIIVGSGLAGLHAAYPLVESGAHVTMLDVGFDEAHILEEGTTMNFEEHRQHDAQQDKIFLGNDLSGIGAAQGDAGHAGAMTSGRRGYIVRSVDRYAPVQNPGTVITQSLASGGLSEAWGAVCGFFTQEELQSAGLPPEEMKAHYTTIIERIGVSGPSAEYDLQPPAEIDDNSKNILRTFLSKKPFFDRIGFRVNQPALALLTRDKDSRSATAYRDMDFWDNIGRSIYRGHYTLEKLRSYPNFTYISNSLVKSVRQDSTTVIVAAEDTVSHQINNFRATHVVMAAGAINTTRILLQSFGIFDTPVPLILKNNYLIPSLLLPRLGRISDPRRHSLCQLTMTDTKRNNDTTDTYVQLYSYNSLLLYKLLRYVPLPIPEALSLLSRIVPSMILADVRFSASPGATGVSVLRRHAGGNYLEITHTETSEHKLIQDKKLKPIKRALRALGLLPLTSVRNAFGATSHYAGGVPYSDSPTTHPLSVDRNGRLHQADRIYVADAASWNSLPGVPPALTIMANANRIGTYVSKSLQN